MSQPDLDQTELAKRLYPHYREATIVDYARVAIEAAWQPWAKSAMRTRQRGPLTTQAGQPFEAGSCLISRTCRVRSFVSWHIQLCKTLTESCGTSHLQHWRPRASYPFFRHPGTADEFRDFVERHGLIQVDHFIDQ
jgi:hypothetical protein